MNSTNNPNTEIGNSICIYFAFNLFSTNLGQNFTLSKISLSIKSNLLEK